MTAPYKETRARGGETSEHIVQLFDSAASRAETVSAFLATGLEQDETVLSVLTPRNWTLLAHDLAQRSVDVDAAIGGRQLIVLDAGETFTRVLLGGVPDGVRFEQTIASTIRHLLARGRRLRIYGEMVDLLAAERDFDAARRLEELWNAFSERHSFTLFCGYSSAHFGDPRSASALALICRCHSAVHTKPSDDLGTFLVHAARNGSARASTLYQ